MTRPRKPFGANHPGRLPATMMKVLAAEMSDPSRLRRGKQYAKDGSVLDIVIDPKTVTCEIQGSRSTPYIAVVMVKPGDGMPLRRDISFTCTCPDDGNWDGYACKHVVASLFTLSDELLLEPDLLDLWRGRTEPHDPEDDPVDGFDDDDLRADLRADEGDDARWSPRRDRRHLHLVGGRNDPRASPAPVTPPPDPLAELLRLPDGAVLPDVGEIERIEPQLPKSRELATVLRDALGNLRIDWD
jgi:hypothetical protein